MKYLPSSFFLYGDSNSLPSLSASCKRSTASTPASSNPAPPPPGTTKFVLSPPRSIPTNPPAKYKDSAYIYVGGLPHQLTEGDVVTIFSQYVPLSLQSQLARADARDRYGEVVDVSLPRDPATQKPKGFAFLMYADQRSTVLAVDNLGGAKVLERTLRVDHVLNYKQLERDKETGKMVERDAQRYVLSLPLSSLQAAWERELMIDVQSGCAPGQVPRPCCPQFLRFGLRRLARFYRPRRPHAGLPH